MPKAVLCLLSSAWFTPWYPDLYFFGSLPGLQRGECVCISLSLDLSIHTARLRDPFEQCNDRWQELGWRELPNQFVYSTWYCKALREALARSEVPDGTDAFTSELELPHKRLTHCLVLGIAHPIQSLCCMVVNSPHSPSAFTVAT